MSYLTSMLLIWTAMGVFLWLVAKMQKENWPSDNARTAGDAFRELFLM